MQRTKHTIKSEPPVKMFGFFAATFFRSLCAFMMLLVLFSPIVDMVNDYVCQCALQRDPPCARKSDPPLGVMCKDTKWGFNEGGKRGVA